MLMQLAVGLTTGAFAVLLVYGMKKVFALLNKKRSGLLWKEAIHEEVSHWYDWLAIAFATLFIIMIVVGVLAPM